MKANKKSSSFSLDEHLISVKTSTVIQLDESFSIYTMEGPIDFRAQISCDLVGIPEKYHEICLNVLTSKYTNKVSFGRNPFSECKPIVKRKWWQFWKSEYFESTK